MEKGTKVISIVKPSTADYWEIDLNKEYTVKRWYFENGEGRIDTICGKSFPDIAITL